MAITARKPMIRCWIVKAAPGFKYDKAGQVSRGENVTYSQKEIACTAAEYAAINNRGRYVVFEAVACYDIACAEEVSIVDAETDQEKF